MERVILFKSEENSGEYKSVFENNRYIPIFIPVLGFVFQNLEVLLSKLKQPNEYSGIVFTSPRSIDAVSQCLKTDRESILERWNTKNIYTVGDATNKKLYSDIHLNSKGYMSGNAASLGDFIIVENETCGIDKPLLFPCGNLRSETLPQKLHDENIHLDSCVVYSTEMDSDLGNNISKLYDNGGVPMILIFFSPSGVNYVVPILKEMHYNFDEAKLIAIGPSTEKKIKELGLKCFSTAIEPTAQSIFVSIDQRNKM